MRLRSLAPLPTNLVSSLDECGIKTETDLLFSNTTVDVFRKLPPGTTSLHELNNYTALVAERASAFHTRADDLLELKPFYHDLVTGVPELDSLLAGLGGSQVLEIAGDKDSGKTVSGSCVDIEPDSQNFAYRPSRFIWFSLILLPIHNLV
jgi:RAD51-like protein 3